jgi:hypothetical protein
MNESINELHEIMETFLAQDEWGYSTEYRGQKVYVGLMPLDTVHRLVESYRKDLPRLQKMIDDTRVHDNLTHVTELLCGVKKAIEMYIPGMEKIINRQEA